MEESRAPSWRMVRRRRAAGVLVAIALVVAAWLAFVRGDGDGESDGSAAERDRPAAALAVPAEVAGLVDGLDPDELAEQVLLVGFEGTDRSAAVVGEVRDRQLGGVLVGSGNWLGSSEGTALVRAIRAAGRSGDRIPPLLVTAQEGGSYRALLDLPPLETQLEIGDAGSEAAAERWARTTAAALADAGFDLNLSPIADVATLDSPIADRAFSDDPALAALLTAAAVRGCREAELGCAVAHFPGLGAASQDTGRGPATVSLDRAGLAARDLQAFRAAFAERVPAVVLSLSFYVAYDPVTPGALSEPVTTRLLRDELGFDGVAITDELGAGAVRASLNMEKAAVRALAAGADLLQIGSPDQQEGVEQAILDAVGSGELSEARLRQAAGRVLELKRKLGLLGE